MRQAGARSATASVPGVADYSLPFRGAPPSRDKSVLDQWSNFDPGRWQALLDDAGLWPPELTECPHGSTGRKWPYVTRRVVFEVAKRATEPRGAAQTYVAAAVWGSGTSPLEVARRGRALASSAAALTSGTVGERLAKAVAVLLDPSGGPVAAYDALHGLGEFRVAGIGPSYGTKVLYFAGFDRVEGHLQPLILDKNVVAALNRLCAVGWASTGWPTVQYRQYLDLAHRWADEWGTPHSDVVERTLFAVGQASTLAVSALSGR